ncbi:uncharacterized protein K460DRAFT_158672 [Cucurbitaria berberidis CBS 394.84]|uniref:Uncharacterized protein n=1 Tax=Cucurbitaria berberidis CBS 394.84 TaxID=1168544 RepID=A0A9P4L6M9_9PLEO|nr:uncharacterized protein K460DRAFT_158672 [Cucurbitaria berberidis CBS 394.84]KAF1844131.1 hypothetical protein K460DRAFT_158672 [Cucurbitaria berberidis CBS 394.84]
MVAMDNTTLHTFLFHCPVALRSIVLLGSWDNFSRPYSLKLDARRGRNLWKGCFTFSDIICDGDLDQLSPKRDGLLRMGGTYWYYYKVDDDEECHNPSEPSTTLCPLLPGQCLNVLELPSEGHSRSMSDISGAFTRNPQDRYLTPVPPAPLRPPPSLRVGVAGPDAYPMPMPSPWAPRSATYPPADRFLSPNVVRHARSASASPRMPSTPIFADFKVLKDKLASRTRSGSKPKELEIGSPVLVSTTNEELNLIPLSVYQHPPTLSPRVLPPATATTSLPVPTVRREFSPLASHPVDPINDPVFNFTAPPVAKECMPRRRSHVTSTVVASEFKLGNIRSRANSADTRRTQHYLFSNDPWLSSPKLQQEFESPDRLVADDTPSAPVLLHPSSLLELPAFNERPTSSHGGDRSPNIRQAPLDKELPALPRFLKPAPLFTRNSSSFSPVLTEEPQQELEEEEDMERLDDFRIQFNEKPRSHFSTWSSDSIGYSCPASDDGADQSPTFSSLASNCSELGSPQQFSRRYSYTEQTDDTERTPTMHESELNDELNDVHTTHLSVTPPQLDNLRISTFGSDLFNLDIQHTDTAPRRQAACFGLGFYTLPDDEITSKSTITDNTLRPEPTINVQRDSSMSQLNTLMDEFAFLGDSVI